MKSFNKIFFLKYLEEFTDVYVNSPIKDNAGGMSFNHSYFTYFVLNKICLFLGCKLKASLRIIFIFSINFEIIDIFEKMFSDKEINTSKIKLNILNFLIKIFITVARGRIELPTPCFSDKGKPCDLVSV